MTEEIEIPTDLIDLVTMEEDKSLRVDIKRIRRTDDVHRTPLVEFYKPGDPVYSKLLELTGIKEPGDNYSFTFENQRNSDKK
ncbi:MAG: hypothetical protein K8F91_09265 [Candidatus Obscuribacterales bacterium]|nr:hypothetical protein [Candidatus Obscuribacterales bacterium]